MSPSRIGPASHGIFRVLILNAQRAWHQGLLTYRLDNQNATTDGTIVGGSASPFSRSGIALNHYEEGARDSRTAAEDARGRVSRVCARACASGAVRPVCGRGARRGGKCHLYVTRPSA